MWWRGFKDKIKGNLRVKEIQTCFYDMDMGGSCFDEDFYVHDGNDEKTLNEMGRLLTYVETDLDENKCDKSRVFVHMDDGSVYELLMRKLTKEELRECSNFYGGRENTNTNNT